MIGVRGWMACVLALAPSTVVADSALDRRIETLVVEVEHRVGDVPVVRANALILALAGDNPPILLDVRSDQERAVSMIAGALTAADDIPRGADVVVYCTVGLRSGNAARELRQRGVNAVNLRGGVLAWLAAGGTVVDASGAPTRRVHVYGRRWDLLPEGYRAVW